MREIYDTNANPQTKRVSVRTGGAGHAHSGIVRTGMLSVKKASTAEEAALGRRAKSAEPTSGKIVKLGR